MIKCAEKLLKFPEVWMSIDKNMTGFSYSTDSTKKFPMLIRAVQVKRCLGQYAEAVWGGTFFDKNDNF